MNIKKSSILIFESADYLFPLCDYYTSPETCYINDHWIVGMYDEPLSLTIRATKSAIMNYGPVTGGFIVNSDWADNRSGVYVHDGHAPISATTTSPSWAGEMTLRFPMGGTGSKETILEVSGVS